MGIEPSEFDNIDDALREIEALRRSMKRRERDNRMLMRLNENSERLRQVYEREREIQYLYNDLLLAHTPNMVFLFNEELEYVLGSRASERLTGHNHRHLLHRPLPLVFSATVDGIWVEKICLTNIQVLRDLKQVEFNDTIDIGTDEHMHVSITVGPILDDSGTCRGTIMSITDVSELVQARHRAEAAAESKSSFLANMSHEIRTPMNAIKGLSELLSLTILNQTQQNYVKNIVGSANSLIGIINDVLDFSKIDANKIEFVPVSYSLHKLLSELCGVIGLRAEEKGLALYLDIDPKLPSRLIGDDSRIKQILLNLLSNAVKYTPEGHVLFKVGVEPLPNGRVNLICAVRDTGIGIKENDAALLFDVYSRVDRRVNRSIQGTGLGLAISKRLAEAMGGDVILSSVYGQGSVFTLSLPQIVDDDVPLACVDTPDEVHVLLLGSGPRLANTSTMLDALKVKATVIECDDTGKCDSSQADALQPLAGGNERPNFTHCIYPDTVDEQIVAALRTRLPNCRFAMLRSIIHSMDDPGRHDSNLFNPLLVTELSKFLNRSGRRTNRISKPGETNSIPVLRVRNVAALVVDDNRINLMVCERMLELYGVSVTTASGGEEALELCRDNKFDILFVDHMMPGIDGVEVTGEIRNHPGPNRESPIVALTANVVNDMRSYYIECGMDDFVGKPIDRAELTRVLIRWLPDEKIVGGTPAKP